MNKLAKSIINISFPLSFFFPFFFPNICFINKTKKKKKITFKLIHIEKNIEYTMKCNMTYF